MLFLEKLQLRIEEKETEREKWKRNIPKTNKILGPETSTTKFLQVSEGQIFLYHLNLSKV